MTRPVGAITELLARSRQGDAGALDELLPIVYQELRDQAARVFSAERRSVTLEPTALVHEAYLRLLNQTRVQWNDRAHFFSVAAMLMRRILVDHARARHADKRGGTVTHVTLSHADRGAEADVETRMVELLALDSLIERLSTHSARHARIVELRVFAGLTVDEVAQTLNLSPRTIKVDWQLARAWLVRELGADPRE